jgi:hypothetical protein
VVILYRGNTKDWRVLVARNFDWPCKPDMNWYHEEHPSDWIDGRTLKCFVGHVVGAIGDEESAPRLRQAVDECMPRRP